MGNYVADFVSHSCRLIIELDGESHDFESRQRADAIRDAWFASRGYRVLRFTNDDVLKNLEGVVLTIAEAVRSDAPPSLSLPRRKSGLPDLRTNRRSSGEPELRGGGNDETTAGA